jgi:hypothetical protein
MLYREIIGVCSEIQTKHINTLCGQKVEFVNVKPGGEYSNHWAVKGLRISHKRWLCALISRISPFINGVKWWWIVTLRPIKYWCVNVISLRIVLAFNCGWTRTFMWLITLQSTANCCVVLCLIICGNTTDCSSYKMVHSVRGPTQHGTVRLRNLLAQYSTQWRF